MSTYLIGYTLTLNDYAVINAENEEAAKEKTKELIFESLKPSEYADNKFVIKITEVDFIGNTKNKQQS
jgi:hypothetical protein